MVMMSHKSSTQADSIMQCLIGQPRTRRDDARLRSGLGGRERNRVAAHVNNAHPRRLHSKLLRCFRFVPEFDVALRVMISSGEEKVFHKSSEIRPEGAASN